MSQQPVRNRREEEVSPNVVTLVRILTIIAVIGAILSALYIILFVGLNLVNGGIWFMFWAIVGFALDYIPDGELDLNASGFWTPRRNDTRRRSANPDNRRTPRVRAHQNDDQDTDEPQPHRRIIQTNNPPADDEDVVQI